MNLQFKRVKNISVSACYSRITVVGDYFYSRPREDLCVSQILLRQYVGASNILQYMNKWCQAKKIRKKKIMCTSPILEMNSRPVNILAQGSIRSIRLFW